MKHLLGPAVLVACALAATPGTARTVVGTVATADPAGLRLSLREGAAFTLPDMAAARAVLASLRPGAPVAVTEDRAADGSWSYDAVWPNGERVGNHPR